MDDPIELRVSTVGRVHPNTEVRIAPGRFSNESWIFFCKWYAHARKKVPSSYKRIRTHDLPIANSDALVGTGL